MCQMVRNNATNSILQNHPFGDKFTCKTTPQLHKNINGGDEIFAVALKFEAQLEKISSSKIVLLLHASSKAPHGLTKS